MLHETIVQRSVLTRSLAAPPWRAVLEAADRKRPLFEAALREAARIARDVFDPVEADKQLAAHDERGLENNLLRATAGLITVLEARLPKAVEATMAAGGEAAARDARRLGRFRVLRETRFDNLRFDLVNPEAVAWARERSSTLITGIGGAQRAAIRDIISRSFTEGLTTAESGRLIRELIGLTPVQANAVLNLRRAILENPGKKLWAGSMPIRVPKGGAGWDFIFRRGEQYAQRLLNYRAHTIARTETIAASNFGQLSLWRQAADKGLIGTTDEKRWIVTPDERLCSICEGLGGEQVPLNESFSVGVEAPPAHASCRCTMGLARPLRKLGEAPLRAPQQLGELFNSVGGRSLLDQTALDAVAADIQRMNSTFPDFARLKSPGLEFVRTLGNLNGTYNPGGRDIAIAVGDRVLESRLSTRLGRMWSMSEYDKSYLTTLRHELGHHFHYRGLGLRTSTGTPISDVAREWDRLFDSASKAHWRITVSQYGSTNSHELFAESFAAWTHPNYTPGLLPREVEAFLERVLPRTGAPAVTAPVSAPIMPAPSAGVPPAPPVPPAGTSRILTTADGSRIVALRQSGWTRDQIADEYTRLAGRKISLYKIDQILKAGGIS